MLLTLVFKEAEQLFHEQRQWLNDLAMAKTQPKVKCLQPKLKAKEHELVDTCCSHGVGGKAGKIIFPIFIGQSNYLCKS
jgi:hypothetical protein